MCAPTLFPLRQASKLAYSRSLPDDGALFNHRLTAALADGLNAAKGPSDCMPSLALIGRFLSLPL